MTGQCNQIASSSNTGTGPQSHTLRPMANLSPAFDVATVRINHTDAIGDRESYHHGLLRMSNVTLRQCVRMANRITAIAASREALLSRRPVCTASLAGRLWLQLAPHKSRKPSERLFAFEMSFHLGTRAPHAALLLLLNREVADSNTGETEGYTGRS